ncbi:MAG: AAA family ATPase [Cytophagaceae bacterium]|nr:AAA family ATPase [Cytophagaceae bacterium]MBL0304308.1 AAA family ATPase [Cytophagaceae bacterium]
MAKDYKKYDKSLSEQVKNIADYQGMQMPYDIEQENYIIGTIIAVPNELFNVIDMLNEFDFYSEKNQTIYRAIINLHKKGQSCDSLGVVRELRSTGEIEFVGGARTIAEYTSKYWAFKNMQEIALYIVELSKKRQLITLGTKITHKSYDSTSDVFELIDEVQKGIVELLTFKFSKETDFIAIATKSYKDISERKENELPGIPSKFRQLNQLTGGYRKGNLYTVAGRPGMGKSLFLVNEAYHQASVGFKTVIFSLEMPASEVTTRIFSLGTQIESYKFDKNILTNDERLVIEKFIHNNFHNNIFIDDSGGIDLMYITSQIKRIKNKNENIDKSKKGVDIVYIDYLQLIKLDRDNRNEGLGQITRSLKSLAKALDICIVIFSQLNRQVENRAGDRRPQLSDLKESGSIEEDSDVVLFLYRPEYYNITETETGESTKGLIEVITSKNRQGGKDSSFMRFLPTISTIVESRENLDNNSMQNNSNIESFESEVPKSINSENVNF